jgi:TolA-binding protein
MIRRALLALVLAAPLAAGPAAAQTAADLLMRLDSIEAELRRLTARLEETEFQARREAAEADARIRDLEFRIIELEGGDPTAALRGDAPASAEPGPGPSPPPAPVPPAESGAGPAPGPQQLGTLRGEVDPGERAAFEAALGDVEALGPTDGARSVEAFVSRYPRSRYAPEARLALGEAFAAENRQQEAARQFLTGFRAYETSGAAPELLLRLGETLERLGRGAEGCAAFAEFAIRFPDAAPSLRARADSAARRARCP